MLFPECQFQRESQFCLFCLLLNPRICWYIVDYLVFVEGKERKAKEVKEGKARRKERERMQRRKKGIPQICNILVIVSDQRQGCQLYFAE